MIIIFDSKRLEQFRDFKITKSDLYGDDPDFLDLQVAMEQKVQILPYHIIALLEKYKAKEITEDQFADWINIIWFSDFFEYCDECNDCISSIVDELEEVNDGEPQLDCREIEKCIQKLLKIDAGAATEKQEMEVRFRIKDHLLSIVVGLQVLYAVIKILMYLTYIVGTDLLVLINPISIYVLIPYLCIVFLGIKFILEKPFAWYGITSSFLYLFYKNIIELIVLGVVLLFGDSIASFYKTPLPAMRMISSVISMIIGLLISAFVLKLLLQNDTLESFNIKIKSKLILILINTGIVAVTSALYFGAVILLIKN